MILWLNGPYGVGKSTLAETLHVALPDSFIFDAEQVGNAIRDNMPEAFYHETFEEYPLWRETCVRLLADISRSHEGHVLVPMTLMHPASMDIFAHLKAEAADVRHVILKAEAEAVHRRILMRGEEPDCWCARQTARCLDAQMNMPCDLRLPADDTPESLAKIVINTFKL
ncbi:MAG: AAA family ATPase [Clostridia bacterium]|nr:AAA family ATPase [Clostridia bacterium]